MKLINEKRRGLFAGHNGIAPITVRATIPAIEALTAAGAMIEHVGTSSDPVYRVTLGKTMPAGIVACTVNGPPYVDACLRLEIEPEWPMGFAERVLEIGDCP